MKQENISNQVLYLLADTNLFFEFKKLHELPWAELDADPIVLLVSKPVLDEIDKHKKGNGRTRDRAIEVFKMLRTSMKNGGSDIVIQETAPRVLLRHIGSVLPDENLREQLDFQKNDDRLVGILSTILDTSDFETVELFTDDTGPVSTAQGLGLPFRFIEDDWRRPAEETTEIKRIKTLEKDLATYRSQEPSIDIQHGETVLDGAVIVTRRVAKPLTPTELETISKRLKAKHPLQEDFTPPPTRTVKNPLDGAKTEFSYEAPSQEDIDQYRDVTYPKWLEDCKATFRKLAENMSSPEPQALVSWKISNVGTRPASQVRIKFKANGPIALVRPKDDEDDNDKDEPLETMRSVKLSLPNPPAVPSFKEIKREIDPPRSVVPKGLDIAKMGNPGASIKGLYAGSAAFRAAQASMIGTTAAGRVLKQFHDSPVQKMLREQNRLADIINPPHLRAAEAFASPVFEPVMRPPIDLRQFHPPKHDPEAFYFDGWKAGVPVRNGALTCDLWRHQQDTEEFEYEVVFTKDGAANGAVLCTIHAENLTEPASLRIPVSRTIEEFSVLDEALSMVDEL